jgi:Fe-Mn family superoxide dismutase
MSRLKSRRNFIADTTKAGLGLYVGSSLLSSCAGTNNLASPKYITGYTQAPLPYNYNALNEAIDAATMEIHFTKHAASYATNLRDAAKAEGVDVTKPVENLLQNISKYSGKNAQ